ncbi:fumarate reductase cytochrome b subunit [Sulfurimonas sp.]|nr:fumarate reductase cytochrome b subunit [Sulfurimonas sp.]
MDKNLSRLKEVEEKFGVRKSRMTAKLDYIQSVTGFLLAIFIMGHIVFESSILVSEEFMYSVTLMFEGYFLFGSAHPEIVSGISAIVFVLFITHAFIAMRKFPSSYKQFKIIREHAKRMQHEDTSLWIVQIVTGFIMFFAGSVHIYMMMTLPSEIGPYQSASRITHDYMWILYSILLVTVIIHAFVGLYRLAIKWGFTEGPNHKVSRKRFKVIMKVMIVAYLVLGFTSLGKYLYIGNTHDFEKEPVYKSKTIVLERH